MRQERRPSLSEDRVLRRMNILSKRDEVDSGVEKTT